MKIEINIPDRICKNLSKDATEKLTEESTKYVKEIIDEANRIENRRFGSKKPEITASIIGQAVFFKENFLPYNRKSIHKIILQILTFSISAILGGLFDIEKFKDSQYVITFLFVFLLAIILHIITYLIEK